MHIEDPKTSRWAVKVFCSDCSEEEELVVEEIDEVDEHVCPCGYSYMIVGIATFTPG